MSRVFGAIVLVGCLVIGAEGYSRDQPSGDPPRSSGDPRVKFVRTIRIPVPNHATFGIWNADGSRVAIGERLDHRVGIFEFPSGRRLPAPMHQRFGVSGLAYSPDGQYFAVARGQIGRGTDRFTVSIWDAGTMVHLENLVEADEAEMPHIGVQHLAFSPDSRYLATSYETGVFLYQIDPARGSRRVAHVGRTASRLAFSADGVHLVAARGLDTTVHELPSGRITAALPHGTAGGIAFRPDNRQLALGSWSLVRLFDTTSWRQTAGLPIDAPDKPRADTKEKVQALAYTPDGRYLVVGVQTVVQLWDTETGARLAMLTDHRPDLISAVALTRNGRFIAAFGGGLITIWELTTQ